jgi:hypothetical protein
MGRMLKKPLSNTKKIVLVTPTFTEQARQQRGDGLSPNNQIYIRERKNMVKETANSELSSGI